MVSQLLSSNKRLFNKILIVNRGEIAVRIIKACRELNITSAVVYSDIDKNSLHVRTADEAYPIGPSQASESYLNKSKIIKLALEIGADAIHPGYGFLSENHEFIKMVEQSGIVFIGPSSDSVKLMGNKTAARKLMKYNKVPIVPGTTKAVLNLKDAYSVVKEIGFPVMIKASAGGGGKGMRKVLKENEFESSFNHARNEAYKAFGNSEVYIEKLLVNPKHIEVQILADKFGNYVHLFERECSVQRRHQKVLEESPSISIDEPLRNRITKCALHAAKACNYYNAGTIEFLMDRDKRFYFLEMNTRLQVEHPVTELITGIDLVKEQIKIAAGLKLNFKQEEISRRGHAIECRIYAEDVDNNFAPSTGKILHHRLPSGPGIRIDRGIDLKSEVPVYYDPLLSKVSAWGRNREEAIERIRIALSVYQISGVVTNIPAFNWLLKQKSFLDGSFDINFIENEFMPLVPDKWKDQASEEREMVAAIFCALLKKKGTIISPNRNNVSQNWLNQNHE